MTVQELIDKLMEIPDKTLPVHRGDSEYGGFPVVEVETVNDQSAMQPEFYNASRDGGIERTPAPTELVVIE